MREFIKDFIKKLDVESGRFRVSVLTFGYQPTTEFYLSDYNSRLEMMTAIDSIHYDRGSTNMAAMMETLRNTVLLAQYGDRPNNQDILVIFTDGNSDDTEETLRQVKFLRERGVHIITAVIGSWLDLYELQQISSYPYQQNVIQASGFSGLQALLNPLRDAVCNGKFIPGKFSWSGQCILSYLQLGMSAAATLAEMGASARMGSSTTSVLVNQVLEESTVREVGRHSPLSGTWITGEMLMMMMIHVNHRVPPSRGCGVCTRCIRFHWKS